jgi:hypothetical protein
MTREQNVAALAGAIRKLIEALIARDQGHIGTHELATEAQADLGDAIRRVLGTKAEESAQ